MTGYFRQGNKVNSSQFGAAEVREQISRCLNILGGIKVGKLIDIKVTINLTKNGALEKSPIILISNLYKRNHADFFNSQFVEVNQKGGPL